MLRLQLHSQRDAFIMPLCLRGRGLPASEVHVPHGADSELARDDKAMRLLGDNYSTVAIWLCGDDCLKKGPYVKCEDEHEVTKLDSIVDTVFGE